MKSSFFNISNGVRQGRILSPTLFSVYMDALSNLLISSDFGCFLNNVCFNHVFFADDLCLMAPCAIALQELLNICHKYSIIADSNMNGLKSFCGVFTPKSFKLSFPKLHINTAFILYTDSLKYLGFIFTSSDTDDNGVLQQMRMLYARSNRLVRLFHSCSRNVLYCIVFYCIVLYCIVLYCIVLYCIVLYCIMRPYTDGPIGPLSYRHSSGVIRNSHSACDPYHHRGHIF